MSSAEIPHRGSPYAAELISHLEPCCTLRTFPSGEQLDLQVNGEAFCYLILEGSVAIYRRKDNLMLSTANSPALFGVANLATLFFDDYLKTVTPCRIGVIPAAQMDIIIQQKGLWELLYKHLMYMYNHLYNSIVPLGAPNAYELIRHQLLQLMSEEEHFRFGITAEKYIREKTQLSRSGVMRILADLKAGNYIEMENGRLIKINKLPPRY